MSTKNTLSSKFKHTVVALVRDESGQSTTEYVLLLLFVVVAVKSVGGQLKERLNKILNAAFDKTDQAISNSNAE